MHERHLYRASEKKFTTGLPIALMLLSMMVIVAYLLVGATLSDGDQTVAIVLPKPIVASSR